jgi:hypothetical protein
MSQRFLAAAVQLCAGSEKGANLDNAERLVRLAAAEGAALIVLPEVRRGPRDQEGVPRSRSRGRLRAPRAGASGVLSAADTRTRAERRYLQHL